MSIALSRWKIRQRQRPMTEQLAQWRRSGRETRYLTSNPVNAARLRESIQQLNQHT